MSPQPIAPGARESAVPEHTVLRSRPAPPEEDATPPAQEAPVTVPRDPRRRLLAWIGVGAAAVVVLGVVAALVANVLAPSGAPRTPTAGTGDDGGIAVTVVPPPVLVSAVRAADGASATFAWKTEDPEKGDQYTWVQEGTTNGPSVTADPKVTVTGLTPGVPVCIDIATVRAGRTSEQLKACAS